ncbi:RidA family protein [Larkinella ripae]
MKNLFLSHFFNTGRPAHTLYCAGQAAMNAEDQPVAVGMDEQIKLCLDNLETVLQQAGYSLADVVRLTYYTTSIEPFFAAYDQITNRLKANNCRPASTLLDVKALALPELMIEIEATAVN